MHQLPIAGTSEGARAFWALLERWARQPFANAREVREVLDDLPPHPSEETSDWPAMDRAVFQEDEEREILKEALPCAALAYGVAVEGLDPQDGLGELFWSSVGVADQRRKLR